MRHLFSTITAALFCGALLACSSSEDSAGAAGGGDESDTPGLDGSAEAARVAGGEASAQNALASAKAVLAGFIEDDPTLDTTKDAAANADAIAARITEQSGGCAVVTHAAGSPTVTADFGAGCTLKESGVTVSGKVSLTVTSEAGKVTVVFVFTTLSVDGYTLDGTATVATSDLKVYALKADLTIASQGKLTFDGTASARVEGQAVGTTLDGTATYAGASPSGQQPPALNGFTCADAGTTLAVAGLHRLSTACYADAGKVTATKKYTCTKAGKKGPISTALQSVTTVLWSATSATTGEVSVTVATGDGAGTTSTARLPAHGGCGS